MASLQARVHGILWGLFSIGGIIAAFLLPVLIYVNNIAYPLGLWPMVGRNPASLLTFHHRLASLFIFITIGGSLFHGIYRFQTTLGEVGLKKWREKLVAVGYAIIGMGILALAYYLWVLTPSLLRFP